MVITSLKPEHDFVELMEEDAEEGMHIKGEVQYVLDCFAYEEKWRESSRYGFSTAAETYQYLSGGEAPATNMGEFFYVQQPAFMRTVQGLFGAGVDSRGKCSSQKKKECK